MRVLVVEDDPTLRRTLTIALQGEGYHVLPAADGRTALQAAQEDEPDLILLDLGLPDIDGVEVLTTLRAASHIPVIVLTARSESDDKVGALDSGADDYVTKPFGVEELLARIRAAVRRTPHSLPTIKTGELTIDLTDRRLTRAGAHVHLTPTEWAMLEVLIRADGRLVSRTDLLQEVWGHTVGHKTNYLRTYVGTLRKKLETDPAQPKHLVTDQGQGYRFFTAP